VMASAAPTARQTLTVHTDGVRLALDRDLAHETSDVCGRRGGVCHAVRVLLLTRGWKGLGWASDRVH
jgi:hypothetical protein